MYRSRRVLVAAFSAVLALGGGSLAATATPVPAQAAEDTPIYSYTILDGEMDYAFNGSQNCVFPTEACNGTVDSFRTISVSLQQSASAALSVSGGGITLARAGEPSPIAAPLAIDSFAYSFRESRSIYGYCGYGTTTTTERDPVTDGIVPSYIDADVIVTPGTSLTDFDVALSPFAGTEPRFGWLTTPGLHYNSSDRYPRATQTYTTPGGECWGGQPAPTSVPVIQPFTFPFAENVLTQAETSVTEIDCISTVLCRMEATGSASWGFPVTAGGLTYAGGGTVSWTFEILAGLDNKQCNDGVVEYEGALGQESWFAFTVQANACEGGSMVPASVQTTGDVVVNATTLGVLSVLFTLQYDQDASTIRASGTDATVKGAFDLCVSPLEFIPAGSAAGKGIGKLTGWAEKFGADRLAGKFAKFVIKHYNDAALKVWTEIGGSGEAIERLNGALQAAFESTAEGGLSTLLNTKICVPAWEIESTVVAKNDGSGLYYSWSDTGVFSGFVTREVKAEPL
jgi:hypothetical protein